MIILNLQKKETRIYIGAAYCIIHLAVQVIRYNSTAIPCISNNMSQFRRWFMPNVMVGVVVQSEADCVNGQEHRAQPAFKRKRNVACWNRRKRGEGLRGRSSVKKDLQACFNFLRDLGYRSCRTSCSRGVLYSRTWYLHELEPRRTDGLSLSTYQSKLLLQRLFTQRLFTQRQRATQRAYEVKQRQCRVHRLDQNRLPT